MDPWQTLRKQLNSPKSQRAPITRKLLARKQAGKNGKKNIYTNRTTKNHFTCSLVWPAALYRQLETCSQLCASSCASVCTNLVDTLKIKQTPLSDKLEPQIWVLEWCSWWHPPTSSSGKGCLHWPHIVAAMPLPHVCCGGCLCVCLAHWATQVAEPFRDVYKTVQHALL